MMYRTSQEKLCVWWAEEGLAIAKTRSEEEELGTEFNIIIIPPSLLHHTLSFVVFLFFRSYSSSFTTNSHIVSFHDPLLWGFFEAIVRYYTYFFYSTSFYSGCFTLFFVSNSCLVYVDSICRYMMYFASINSNHVWGDWTHKFNDFLWFYGFLFFNVCRRANKTWNRSILQPIWQTTWNFFFPKMFWSHTTVKKSNQIEFYGSMESEAIKIDLNFLRKSDQDRSKNGPHPSSNLT